MVRAPMTFVPFASPARNSSHAGGGAIVCHDSVAVVVHVENEIPAHYSQSDESDIALGFHYFESHGVCEARTITKSGDG